MDGQRINDGAERGAQAETGAADAVHDRRAFLRAAGFSGAALMLAACAKDASRLVAPDKARLALVSGNNVTLDFSTDTDVLNYAYALEQLEAAFYDTVVTNAAFATIFPANERQLLRDVRDHEVAHRDFFAAALGSAKIPNLTPNFGAIDFGNRLSVLQTARTFEDLGVSAYNGAAQYLRNATYLTLAGKIVSVEARHASAIRDLLQPRTGAFAPNDMDPATAPSSVLASAQPFVVQHITVVNAA